MTMPMPATRWGAATVHAALSVLVVGSIAAAAVLGWFPGGLWHLSGLQTLFGIMLGADIVLGPLLTLVVYRRGKPGLGRDLAVIGLAQSVFLAYGIHTLWLNRPLALVGSDQAFALVFANELPSSAPTQLSRMGAPRFLGHGPWLVGVDLSRSSVRDDFMFAFMAGGGGPLRDPDLYVPYAKVRPAVLAASKAPDASLRHRLATRERVRTLAATSIRTPAAVMLLDATTGQPLRVVP